MKNLFLSTLLLGLFVVASCKKDDVVVANEVKFNVKLTGQNEAPNPVTSTAVGTFVGVYNKDTKVLTYTVSYSDITPTAWHIHKGALGVAGPVVFNFGTTFGSSYSSLTPALTTDQETDLLSGNYYVNIHSKTNPGGEIRAQLVQ